jgi:hypothetical protein
MEGNFNNSYMHRRSLGRYSSLADSDHGVKVKYMHLLLGNRPSTKPSTADSFHWR